MTRLVKFIVTLLAVFQLLTASAKKDFSCNITSGMLIPESFGAKGDGVHDDTEAIQVALDSLDRMGGGGVYFGSGTYMVSSIILGKKTSLIGCGNGATLIKQIKGTKADCIIIPAESAALRISCLSIIGNDINYGIHIKNSQGGVGENHKYLYTKNLNDGIPQPYKWMTIDDICIYHFGTGLFIDKSGFNINVCNSTFSHNVIGVDMRCSDSSIYNCYITNNKKDGLAISSSNNKISNIKSIFNGAGDPINSAAIALRGSRCQITNCETQDNYCKGFYVGGIYNLLTNCFSNTDGYSKEPKGYDPEIRCCGFRIHGLFNTFSNCAVSNYFERFGAVYHSPVIVDEAVQYYYSEILNDIKVLIAKDRLIFQSPFCNVQTLASKNYVEKMNVGTIGNKKYFVMNHKDGNTIKMGSVHTSSLQILLDFRCMGKSGGLIELDGDKKLEVSINQSSITLNWQGNKEAELMLDKDAVFNKDDLRLIVSFSEYQTKRYLSLLIFEKTIDRGWIKKEIRKETTIPATWLNKTTIKMGDGHVPVKRLAITHSPLPESVFLPSSNTNKIYDSAIVYVDADSSM